MSELHGLQTRIDDFRKAGARILAVSPDSVDQNRRVAQRLGLDYRILSDADLALTRSLGLLHDSAAPGGGDVPRPATFIVTDGQIRWRDLTENWRVRIQAGRLVEVLQDVLGA